MVSQPLVRSFQSFFGTAMAFDVVIEPMPYSLGGVLFVSVASVKEEFENLLASRHLGTVLFRTVLCGN